jgi:hypothetical protein
LARGGKKALSLFLYVFFAIAGLLLVLFLWSVRKSRRRGNALPDAGVLEERGRGSVAHLPQIRQAFTESDFVFLSERAQSSLVRRVRRERRQVALAFLSAVREDFDGLLRTATIISVLSPEVAAMQEFERLRLIVKFNSRYRIIRLQLHLGLAPIPRLSRLSDLVSGLSVRMETAMKELGERAALAEELASSLDGRGGDVA